MSGTATTTTETQRVRQEVQRPVQLARDALDHLDPTQAIAACRSLRSILWRAQREGIAVAALVPDPPALVPDPPAPAPVAAAPPPAEASAPASVPSGVLAGAGLVGPAPAVALHAPPEPEPIDDDAQDHDEPESPDDLGQVV